MNDDQEWINTYEERYGLLDIPIEVEEAKPIDEYKELLLKLQDAQQSIDDLKMELKDVREEYIKHKRWALETQSKYQKLAHTIKNLKLENETLRMRKNNMGSKWETPHL